MLFLFIIIYYYFKDRDHQFLIYQYYFKRTFKAEKIKCVNGAPALHLTIPLYSIISTLNNFVSIGRRDDKYFL